MRPLPLVFSHISCYYFEDFQSLLFLTEAGPALTGEGIHGVKLPALRAVAPAVDWAERRAEHPPVKSVGQGKNPR